MLHTGLAEYTVELTRPTDLLWVETGSQDLGSPISTALTWDSAEFLPVQQFSRSAFSSIEPGSNYFWWAWFTQSDAALSAAAKIESCRSARSIIDELGDLEQDWDGYGALPISERARNNARRFIEILEAAPLDLSAPDISPRSSGTISMEWETGDAEAYLEIGNTRFSGYVKASGQDAVYLQGSADAIDQNIIALIHEGVAPAGLWLDPIAEICIPDFYEEKLAA